jgi:hypothetical protein
MPPADSWQLKKNSLEKVVLRLPFLIFEDKYTCMNFLSHYYLGKHIDDPHFTLGVVLPDLARNRDKALRFRDVELKENALSPEAINLHTGVRFHHLTDHLFHNSTFFDSKSQQLKFMLQQKSFKVLQKHHYFMAHIALELLLDRMLLKAEPGLCENFYRHLKETDSNVISAYFNYSGYSNRHADFLDFLDLFNKNMYIQHYVKTDSLAFALSRIYRRATGADISEDKAVLCNFIEEAEEQVMRDYQAVFEELQKEITFNIST